MTDKPDTAKLRELLKAATPGPWNWGYHASSGKLSCITSPEFKEFNLAQVRDPLDELPYLDIRYDDAALIVAAVNALPALLDTLERVEGLVEKWRSETASSETFRNVYLDGIGYQARKCANELQSALSGCKGGRQ